jgi:hypothetical protein
VHIWNPLPFGQRRCSNAPLHHANLEIHSSLPLQPDLSNSDLDHHPSSLSSLQLAPCGFCHSLLFSLLSDLCGKATARQKATHETTDNESTTTRQTIHHTFNSGLLAPPPSPVIIGFESPVKTTLLSFAPSLHRLHIRHRHPHIPLSIRHPLHIQTLLPLSIV